MEDVLLSTTYYYYNDIGNPTRVVTELENPGPGEKQFTSTLMHYAGNGDAVTHVMGETWNNDGSCVSDYTWSRLQRRLADRTSRTFTPEAA